MERVNAANLKRKTPSSWIVLEQTKQGKSLVSLKSNTRCASFTPGKVYQDDDVDDALSIETSERFTERTKGNLICRWSVYIPAYIGNGKTPIGLLYVHTIQGALNFLIHIPNTFQPHNLLDGYMSLFISTKAFLYTSHKSTIPISEKIYVKAISLWHDLICVEYFFSVSYLLTDICPRWIEMKKPL